MNTAQPANLEQLTALIEQGAIFYISHSGGKDSQAMDILLSAIIPAAQRVYVYADLGRVVHAGCVEHIEATTGRRAVRSTPTKFNKAGAAMAVSYFDYHTSEQVPCPAPQDAFLVCKTTGQDFLATWDRKGVAPSPAYRQCTSDLKRGPVQRTIKKYIADSGVSRLVVDCTGIRAEESSKRAKLVAESTLSVEKKLSKAGRTWYQYNPVAHTPLEGPQGVWAIIKAAGQKPHAVYASGMSRLSCVFCIMASPQDIAIASGLRPELYAEYVAMEKKTGYTLFQGQPLPERVAVGHARLQVAA